MNTHRKTAPATVRYWALGLLALLASMTVHAQSGPIATQNLFFNEAGGVHQGNNYMEAQTGVIYTDNAQLVPGGSGDTLGMIGLVGDLARTGAPRLDYHVDSDLALVKYFSNSYDTQPFGYADADAELKLVPGLFSWVGRASFTQAVLDPETPAVPTNLESLTYLTTGPKFTFRPTLQTSVVLGGVYSYVATSSKSPLYVDIDNHRLGADLKISRAFTNSLSAYLSGSYDRVYFTDLTDNTDFSQYQYSVGVTYTNQRTYFDGSIGYTQLKLYPTEELPLEGTNTSPSGTSWSANLSRLISPTQRVTLHASKQLTDAANLFRLNLDQPVPVTGQNQLLNDQPFTHREYGVSWRVESQRSSLQLGYASYTDRYTITPSSNQDSWQINGIFTRQLNDAFIWELGASDNHNSYENQGSFTTLSAISTLRWRVGPRIALRFIYAYTRLTPDTVTENQIGVVLSYALNEAAQAPDTKLQTPMQVISPTMQPRLMH
jgi:hypothetical protein